MILALLTAVAGIMGLALLNAVYVAGEFGLIGSRQSRLESLAKQGRSGAARILAIIGDLRRMDRAIAAIQVGITCASLGLGMYGEYALAQLLRPLFSSLGGGAGLAGHGLASAISVGLLTFIHLVVGEMVPKTLALRDPARAALWTEKPLRWTALLLRPLVVTLAAASRGLLFLLRVRPAGKHAAVLTLEEIELLIEESGAAGALDGEQALLLANLVDFEDLPVRKVMLPRNQVSGIVSTADREAVRTVLRTTRHSRYPVYREQLDDVIGYVHVKDLLHILDGPEPFDLKDHCRRLPYIPETASCAQLLQVLRSRKAHLALVLDEHGGTAGIVTLDDLVEEILGDVQDEFDAEGAPLRQVAAGVAVAHGVLRLDELEDSLSLGLDDDQVDTVAGLVLKGLGRMATPGDAVMVDGVKFTVEALDGLSIIRVRLDWDPARRSPQG
jgi:CBS domain containing-hemolysin-like protein